MNPLIRLAAEFSIVHEVRHKLAAFTGTPPPERIDEIRAALLPLVESSHLNHIDCEEKLLDGQPAMLREVCEELHMHLLAASLASSGRSGVVSQLDSLSHNAIVRGLGGLTYSTIDSNVVMLMPDCGSPGQIEGIGLELLRIFDSQKSTYGWIIDCSAVVTPLPVMFLGTLMAYKEDLKKRGTRMVICWLKPEVTRAIDEACLQECFEVELVGGHWFSRFDGAS